ncbi:alpha/beta hydrolase [Micromonospora sp. C28SCA-DRY-2]|uniref:RBBP9/YdeN family alpha/beta hydrolase n=1 Tax=Micromonospora sp. C28SCA-DRY-2 TaxID=3059522 RepID=UPI0026763BCA|nr:alpha/beta fold hydrolase [Micromonospora sp. C28SCA-DRY-2]MDO3703145.1 alpha/beta hydrolase [Micromonospora sp. C28SCA-DRY-2]
MFIVHGYGATPENHWFPWLRDLLTAHGVEVTVVRLPEPDAPSATEWHRAVSAAVDRVDEGTWIVAHSLGAITVLRRLAALPTPWSLGGAVFVAGFTGTLDVLPVLDTFLAEEVDLAAIAPNIRQRHVIHSDDDAIVPPSASVALADRLRARTHLVRGGGHFLESEGVTTLPLVAEILQLAPASTAAAR